MDSALKRNGALWACAVVVLVTTPCPGSSQSDNATFTASPPVLSLGRGRHFASFTLDCSHPLGSAGAAKRLEVYRKEAADSSGNLQMIAKVWAGQVTMVSPPGEFEVTGNSEHLYVKKAQGDCRDERYLFRCVSNVDGVMKFKELKIESLAIPVAVLQVSPSHGGQMRPAIFYTFTCDALGKRAPELKWSVYVQSNYLDITRDMFAVSEPASERVTDCLVKSTSSFTTDAEAVNTKLRICNFWVRCVAVPQETSEEYSDVRKFNLQISKCQSPIPIPATTTHLTTTTSSGDSNVTSSATNAEAASKVADTSLMFTLIGVIGCLLLFLVGMGILALRKRNQQLSDKAEVVRRLSQLHMQRRQSSMPRLVELQVVRPRPPPSTNSSSLRSSAYTDPSEPESSGVLESSVDVESMLSDQPHVRGHSEYGSETPGIWTRASAQVI